MLCCTCFWRGKVVLNEGLVLRAENLGKSLILISLRDNASKLFLIENNLGAFFVSEQRKIDKDISMGY